MQAGNNRLTNSDIWGGPLSLRFRCILQFSADLSAVQLSRICPELENKRKILNISELR